MFTKVEKSELLLAEVYSTDNDNSTSSFAMIKMTDELKSLILSLRESLLDIKAKHSTDMIYQISAFNSSCVYISEEDDSTTTEEIADCLEVIFDENETFSYVKVSFETLENTDTVYDEVNLLHLDKSTFKFSANIKHTSTKLTTISLPYSVLD